MLKNVIRVKLSNNFKRFKINPDKTVDIESSTCYFLDVPKIPSDSFRSATNFPTILGQYLCLIPISQDRFRIFSLRTALSVMALVCQIIMTFLSFCWLKETGANIFKGGVVLFFGGSAITMALLINLSTKWYNLLNKWEQVEGYFGHQKNLKLKFTLISIVCIIFSMVEHLSYLLTGIITTERENSHEVFEIYVSKMFPQVFTVITYNTWIAVLVLVINSVSTLTFCFSDQIIIMGSLALGNYFQIFNDRMKTHKGKTLTSDQWKTLRVDYTRLCNLTRLLNDCLCHLLCVSLIIHLYIICVELHQGVVRTKENFNLSHHVHAILSFLVSSLRGCLLCLCSVKIYESSKLPKRSLYDIPQQSFCNEASSVYNDSLVVEFFLLQVQKDHIGLTGSHMFLMTRRFLLTVSME
ncbi:hypothetical protein QTP88_016037 [Uroleucon formosanum]